MRFLVVSDFSDLFTEENWIQRAVPPSHRGLFTAKAKRHHLPVGVYARKVLSNPRTSTRTKRQAAFALRAQQGFRGGVKKTEMTTVGNIGYGPDTALGAVPDSRRKKRLRKQRLPSDT